MFRRLVLETVDFQERGMFVCTSFWPTSVVVVVNKDYMLPNALVGRLEAIDLRFLAWLFVSFTVCLGSSLWPDRI